MRNRIALLGASLLALYSLGCTGEAGPAGPKGDIGAEGPSADPSINAVIPGKVFLGRTVDVTVSGFNTKWTDAAKVDFGPGVTILNQTLASPTAIVATIEVTAAADIGARDVNVTDADGTATYKGAFKLESPLDLTFTGSSAQGSILITQAKQLDLSTPFDTTYTGDGFFEPIVYTNLGVTGSAGINASVDSVELYSANLITLVDIDAPAGKGDITVDSGPAGDTIASPAPKSIDIAARMPDAIPEGGSVKGQIDAPLASLLFSFTPSGPGLYSIEATAASADANPALAVLPKSGHFADLIEVSGAPSILATNTDPYYFVYWDNSGTSNYFATVKATKIVTADKDPNDTCAQAQAAGALPASIKNLYLSSDADVDWIAFDVPAGNKDKVIHVITEPGDEKTDTVLEVFAGCTTSLGVSADNDYHEDFISDPITDDAGGKYYVKVTNSTFGYSGKLYNLSIAIEAAPPP